jgi:hypothetical protein
MTTRIITTDAELAAADNQRKRRLVTAITGLMESEGYFVLPKFREKLADLVYDAVMDARHRHIPAGTPGDAHDSTMQD